MFVSMILLVISSWEIVCGEEANDADGEVQILPACVVVTNKGVL